MQFCAVPFADTLQHAETVIDQALKRGVGATLFYDLGVGRLDPAPAGFAVYLTDSSVSICASDHDGLLTVLVARWVQALPSVGFVRPHIAASIERVTDADVLIHLSAFIRYAEESEAMGLAACWETAHYRLPDGLVADLAA